MLSVTACSGCTLVKNCLKFDPTSLCPHRQRTNAFVPVGLAFTAQPAPGRVPDVALQLALLALNLGPNHGYSMVPKHLPIRDVLLLAPGLTLWIRAGNLSAGCTSPQWLLLTCLMLALLQGFAKCHAELGQLCGAGAGHVLEEYRAAALDQLRVVATAGTIIAKGMYSLINGTQLTPGSRGLFYVWCLASYGMFRYRSLPRRRRHSSDTARDQFAGAGLLFTAPVLAGVSLAVSR